MRSSMRTQAIGKIGITCHACEIGDKPMPHQMDADAARMRHMRTIRSAMRMVESRCETRTIARP